jgi:hypothetical protein
MPKKTDWRGIIEQLQVKQKEFQPGDPRILDAESVIQEIRASIFGGNQGHAQYLLNHPKDRKSLERSIRGQAKEFLS